MTSTMSAVSVDVGRWKELEVWCGVVSSEDGVQKTM